jgi:glycosyltransferase involved in cell wall biosynthesis
MIGVLISTPASPVSIGFVSTYPPTACGIASYTAALLDGIASDRHTREGLGVVDLASAAAIPTSADVAYHHRVGDRHSLGQALRVLNGFDTVSIQHEFGIFGGPDGDEVVELVDGLTVPTAVTFHTMLDRPTAAQQRIIEHLGRAADRLIVMSPIAAERLTNRYGVDASRVETIPHGVHPRFGGPSLVEGNRPLVLTWGLIGPGKGLESAIAAFAGLVDLKPRPRYLIAGATHPRVRESAGETYRESLIELVRVHGLEDVVEFDDRYLDRDALARLVRRADFVVLPYESVEQLTSGVLVEAIAASKPVIATAFPHAVDLLTDGAGIVVPHQDIGALAAAIRRLATDRPLRSVMAREAQRLAARWYWPEIGRRFGAMMGTIATRKAGTNSGSSAVPHAG